ncbi:hypothetical protein ACW0US_07220 [Xanthomonas euvesicatoria]
MDFSSVGTAFTSLQIAKEGLNSILGIRDFNAIAPQIATINDQLLKAQDGLFMYAAKVADLQEKLLAATAELSELKKKAEERERYALVELSSGIFVYRLKDGDDRHNVPVEGNAEPVHYLCQKCFHEGTKSILQQNAGLGRITIDCFTCGAKYFTGHSRALAAQTFSAEFGP